MAWRIVRSPTFCSPATAYKSTGTLIVHLVLMTTVKTKKKIATKSKGSKRTLVCANGEQCFWTNDGKIIANLVDLRDTLAKMEESVFGHHVTKQKNDFAEWIGSVLEDPELAKNIRGAQKPHTARLVVVRRLREYDI